MQLTRSTHPVALRSAPERIFKAAARSANRFLPDPPPLRPTTSFTDVVGDSVGSSGNASTDDLSWTSTSLTLASIHGLASSLVPDDTVEVAPVQAWFELVRRFGVDVLMAEGVLEALKREFVGVVRCPHFGAVVERGAFESVVGRVLGGYSQGV